MVPTEEERLPVRVSISVRGLSAFLRSSPITSYFSFGFLTFASHWSCFMQGQRPNEHSLFFTRQLLLIEFPFLCSAFCVRSKVDTGRPSECLQHSYTIINGMACAWIIVVDTGVRLDEVLT